MAPTTALGLARAAPLVHGRVWAYTDGAEAVYVDGTVQNIGLRLARDLLQQLLSRPATCGGGRAAQTKPALPANFAKVWVKAKTSCGTSPIGFAGYSKASQHVFFVRTH